MEAPRIARGSGQGVRAEGQGRGSRQAIRAQGISAGGATREADGGEGAVEEARVGKGAARDVHLGGRAAGGRDADLRIASAEQGRTGRHGSRWLQCNTPGSLQTLLLLRSSIQPIRQQDRSLVCFSDIRVRIRIHIRVHIRVRIRGRIRVHIRVRIRVQSGGPHLGHAPAGPQQLRPDVELHVPADPGQGLLTRTPGPKTAEIRVIRSESATPRPGIRVETRACRSESVGDPPPRHRGARGGSHGARWGSHGARGAPHGARGGSRTFRCAAAPPGPRAAATPCPGRRARALRQGPKLDVVPLRRAVWCVSLAGRRDPPRRPPRPASRIRPAPCIEAQRRGASPRTPP